jgi:hypothetical protein
VSINPPREGEGWDHARTEAWPGPCARDYGRPGYQCPNTPHFTVRLATHQDRKARMACAEHLADVIWGAQRDYGNYDGAYVVTAAPLEELL